MFKHLFGDTDLPLLLVASIVGFLIGTMLFHIPRQSNLLADLLSLAHEQRRMTLAALQREYAAAAAKEQTHDA